MKTCVDITDPLLAEAKEAARTDGTTLRALVEEGLRLVLERRSQAQPAELADLRFEGNGIRPEFRGGNWARIRDAAYDGRGT